MDALEIAARYQAKLKRDQLQLQREKSALMAWKDLEHKFDEVKVMILAEFLSSDFSLSDILKAISDKNL